MRTLIPHIAMLLEQNVVIPQSPLLHQYFRNRQLFNIIDYALLKHNILFGININLPLIVIIRFKLRTVATVHLKVRCSSFIQGNSTFFIIFYGDPVDKCARTGSVSKSSIFSSKPMMWT